jgi:arylsulfatase A-like enzyme
MLLGVLWLGCSSDTRPLPEESETSVESPTVEGPTLVLITVESWRMDHLPFVGYGRDTMPKLEHRLAGGRVFTHAIAPASWTLPSMASIVTGLLPSEHGLRTPDRSLGPEARTTAELLAEQGYQTIFLGSNPWLVDGTGMEQGFESWDARAGASGDRLVRELEDRLTDTDPAAPLFLHLHFFEPHCKYRPPRRQQGLFEPVDSGMASGVLLTKEQYDSMGECYRLQTDSGEPQLDLDIYISRYDAELRATDGLIEESMDLIDATLGLEDTLVVLAGDHGESFWEHGDFGHGRQLFQESVRVPLVLLGGLAGSPERVDTPVSLIDIHPTLLVSAGVKTSSDRDLRLPPLGSPVFSETEQDGVDLRGAWIEDRGVIWDRRQDSWKGYDLGTDPSELSPGYADLLLKRAIRSRFTGTSGPGLSEDSSRGTEQDEVLHSLGYRD